MEHQMEMETTPGKGSTAAIAAVCDGCKNGGAERTRINRSRFGDIGNIISLLNIAAADGHVKCLEALLNAGADVNYTDKENIYTPLMWTARYGHYECMRMLIKAGADVNKTGRGDSPLMSTSGNTGDIKCVELLLNNGADVNYTNYRGGTALIRAVSSGRPDKAKLLIEKEADVNIVDVDGWSAITHSAVIPTGWKCITLLVQAGADVNVKTGGKSPLMWSVENGYPKCVETLIQAGADVNMVVKSWGTALHIASELHNKCFEMLLEAGADVNIKGHSGQTVLMMCMAPWQYNRAEKLIEAGADVNVVGMDPVCRNALFIAAVENSLQTLRLLLRNNARISQLNEYGNNALETYLSLCNTVTQREVCMLLFAAGEGVTKTISKFPGQDDTQVVVPEYLKHDEKKFHLQHLCRMSIREHLLHLDPHTHLFYRMPHLGLPAALTKYLLFYMSIEKTH